MDLFGAPRSIYPMQAAPVDPCAHLRRRAASYSVPSWRTRYGPGASPAVAVAAAASARPRPLDALRNYDYGELDRLYTPSCGDAHVSSRSQSQSQLRQPFGLALQSGGSHSHSAGSLGLGGPPQLSRDSFQPTSTYSQGLGFSPGLGHLSPPRGLCLPPPPVLGVGSTASVRPTSPGVRPGSPGVCLASPGLRPASPGVRQASPGADAWSLGQVTPMRPTEDTVVAPFSNQESSPQVHLAPTLMEAMRKLDDVGVDRILRSGRPAMAQHMLPTNVGARGERGYGCSSKFGRHGGPSAMGRLAPGGPRDLPVWVPVLQAGHGVAGYRERERGAGIRPRDAGQAPRAEAWAHAQERDLGFYQMQAAAGRSPAAPERAPRHRQELHEHERPWQEGPRQEVICQDFSQNGLLRHESDQAALQQAALHRATLHVPRRHESREALRQDSLPATNTQSAVAAARGIAAAAALPPRELRGAGQDALNVGRPPPPVGQEQLRSWGDVSSATEEELNCLQIALTHRLHAVQSEWMRRAPPGQGVATPHLNASLRATVATVSAHPQDHVRRVAVLPPALAESDACVVCQEEQRRVVLQPCKHFVCCRACSSLLQRCPVCRADVTERLEVFV